MDPERFGVDGSGIGCPDPFPDQRPNLTKFATKIWSIIKIILLLVSISVFDHTYISLKGLEKLFVSPNIVPYIHIKFDIFLLDNFLGLDPEPDLEPDPA